MSEVTRILDRAQEGDPRAAEELLPLVYAELRRLAASKMANEGAGHTLQPTALVHEAWLRLAGNDNTTWDGRAHFFAAAAEAMRLHRHAAEYLAGGAQVCRGRATGPRMPCHTRATNAGGPPDV